MNVTPRGARVTPQALRRPSTGDAAAARQAMEGVAAQLQDACDSAATLAEQSADAVARLLLDSLAAAFPVFCARYGEAEVQAIVALGPAGADPGAGDYRAGQSAHRSRRSRARSAGSIPISPRACRSTSSDAMPTGDVRIAWRNGAATRDAATLWAQVAAILAPAGLLRGRCRRIKETVDGD